MSGLEGYIQLLSGLIPTNDNPRQWVTKNEYVQGAPQVFLDVDSLVAFHPARMRKGMPATIINYPTVGVVTDFRLNIDPNQLLDGNNNSIVTTENFSDFWDVTSQNNTSRARVYQYAPDGPGGGAPVYPYTPATESNWSNTFDATKGHRWLRFRDDDIDANDDGIYDNWTVPLPANASYKEGDYIENKFKRQAVSGTLHTSTATMQADKYYVIEQGQVIINGDLSLNEISGYVSGSSITLGSGRRFKYAAANTYTFQNTAQLTETLKIPPRTIAGTPNNDPVGWTDTPPAGSDQLWQITAQKSVYGELKSSWLLSKIIENPDLVRYSNTFTPDPNTLADTNTSAAEGSAGDIALDNAGWSQVYSGQQFMATRNDLGGGTYSVWVRQKISEESGEYTDRVFKLFDLNLDSSSPVLVPPTGRDASVDGWSDAPQEETDTQINYLSEARKYIDGTLKTPWSQPVPYTGQDVFVDSIVSDGDDNFKFDKDGNVTPTQIVLQANLNKGLSELWQNPDNNISYVWKKVYDNGAVVNISPTSNTGDDFYLMAANGAPGDADYARANQRVTIKDAAVTGKAIFRCTQTITLTDGDDLVFTEEFSIVDISDGIDAKSLAVSLDRQFIIYDTVNLIFSPSNFNLRAYQSNLNSPVYYWYYWTGSAWSKITSGVTPGYTISGNTLTGDCATLFAANTTAEEIRFAVSTVDGNPDTADYINTFTDYVTIAKSSSNAVGADGENALIPILSNESHTVILDAATEAVLAGEIGASGKALTTLQFYEGITKKVYGVGNDYTIAVASDNANVGFNYAANGNDVDIYVDSWTAGERSAVCTITITYGAKTLQKKFSISSTKDATNAILLDIDSDKGFAFTPADRTNKILTAKVYDTALAAGSQEITLPDADYTFRWNVAGVWSTPSTTNTRVISRADILTAQDVIVECYFQGTLYRTRTIRLYDVLDAKAYRLYYNYSSLPAEPLPAPTKPTGLYSSFLSTGTDAWTTDPQQDKVYWASDGVENADGSFTWSNPIRIRGEIGSQGPNGNFFLTMYKAGSTSPSFGAGGNTSTLAQMQAASWSVTPPSGKIWSTRRLFDGDGVTFTNGVPNTQAIPGTTWSAPIQLTPDDPTPPNDPVDGVDGWSPVLAVKNNGERRVLQLIDWIGGGGSKPGNIGKYIGNSGFVSSISSAKDIRGAAGSDAAVRPEYYVSVGSRTQGTLTLFNNDTNQALRDGGNTGSIRVLNVVNNYSTSRQFMVHAEWYGAVPGQNVKVELMYSPNVYTNPSKGNLTLVDVNWISYKNKAPLFARVNIAASDNLYFYIWLTEISGSGFYGNTGFLEAWGL